MVDGFVPPGGVGSPSLPGPRVPWAAQRRGVGLRSQRSRSALIAADEPEEAGPGVQASPAADDCGLAAPPPSPPPPPPPSLPHRRHTAASGKDRAQLTAAAAATIGEEEDPAAAAAPRVRMGALKEQPVEDVVSAALGSIHPPLRRLWTKADFLHIHATSGVAFLLGGTLWQAARVADLCLQGGAGASEALLAADSPACALLCAAGLVNAVSAVPMARFSSNQILDLRDLKGNGFSLGGTGLTAMCLWMAWWFSGAYPTALHAADGVLVCVFSLLCILTTINWELMVKRHFSSGDLEFVSEQQQRQQRQQQQHQGSAAGGGSGTAAADAGASASVSAAAAGRRPRVAPKRGRQDRKLAGVVSEEDSASQVAVKKWLYRIASWPNLTQIFFMSSITLGGSAWLAQVLDLYPLQGRLLFDYSFSSALGYSLSMFGETLRDRRLLSLEQDFVVLLVGVLAPMGVVALDAGAAGHAAQINPLLYWAMFGQVGGGPGAG